MGRSSIAGEVELRVKVERMVIVAEVLAVVGRLVVVFLVVDVVVWVERLVVVFLVVDVVV